MSHVWWHRWKLRTVPCPLLHCGAPGSGVDFVLLVLQNESCFLPQEDDAALSLLGKRAIIKRDPPPRCLVVAKMMQTHACRELLHRGLHSGDPWLLEPRRVLLNTRRVPEWIPRSVRSVEPDMCTCCEIQTRYDVNPSGGADSDLNFQLALLSSRGAF